MLNLLSAQKNHMSEVRIVWQCKNEKQKDSKKMFRMWGSISIGILLFFGSPIQSAQGLWFFPESAWA